MSFHRVSDVTSIILHACILAREIPMKLLDKAILIKLVPSAHSLYRNSALEIHTKEKLA